MKNDRHLCIIFDVTLSHIEAGAAMSKDRCFVSNVIVMHRARQWVT